MPLDDISLQVFLILMMIMDNVCTLAASNVKVAVRNLSLGVEEGETFGLLGHNGAGKTTTMRIIIAEEAPTRGKVRIGPHDITSNASPGFDMLGYCPQVQQEPVKVSEAFPSLLQHVTYLTFSSLMPFGGRSRSRSTWRCMPPFAACRLRKSQGKHSPVITSFGNFIAAVTPEGWQSSSCRG